MAGIKEQTATNEKTSKIQARTEFTRFFVRKALAKD
jgi:hypothetical protein